MLASLSLIVLLNGLASAQSTVLSSLPPTSTTARPASITSAPAASFVPNPSGAPRPLTEYSYVYPNVPYQVNPFPVARGPQSGYNQCNSTTAGPRSLCQTFFVNSISDFCLTGVDAPNGLIADSEAAVIAYCSNNKTQHGSRLMPAGTLTGVQFMRTSAYIQVTGHLNMTGVNLQTTDSGGELDPHGADLAGNPLGGLVYSSGLPSGDNSTILQAYEWNTFIGSGIFCFKVCDPTVKSPNYCENRFDLIGCAYNMPASYKDGEFTSCDGELQDVVGVYTGANGQVSTYSQGDVVTAPLPYTPRIPASSNCRTFQSADLYGALPTMSTTSSAAAATGTGATAGSARLSSGAASTGSAGSAASTAAVRSSAGKTTLTEISTLFIVVTLAFVIVT